MPNFGVNGELKYTHTHISRTCEFISVSHYARNLSPMARKMLPQDKLNKSTRMICLIYFSMAQFNDIKFRWRNLNINDLMFINLHISLITKLFFISFHHHSDKTVTNSELLPDINNFSKTIVHVIRKSHEFKFNIVRVIAIVVSNPVNFLVNARPMTSEHCQLILDDVRIFRHLAVWAHLPIFFTPWVERPQKSRDTKSVHPSQFLFP